MKPLEKLIKGYFEFRNKYFSGENPLFGSLSQGQHPKTLVIACSDSRVDPAIVLNSEPGDLFVIRNVANLVPPFEMGGGYHGVSSAIEFAVRDLKVENVIVMGHARCGGIHALVTNTHSGPGSFIGSWVSMLRKAKDDTIAQLGNNASTVEICHMCEQEAIKVSLENLKTFPFIRDALFQNRLRIIGWYIDIETGKLAQYDPLLNIFKPVQPL
jgi:carbonic anhydrase